VASTDKSSGVDINRELEELFAQLAEATIAMGDAVWTVREKPSATIGQILWDLYLQIDAIISRISQILG
jgi:hypothetical protein